MSHGLAFRKLLKKKVYFDKRQQNTPRWESALCQNQVHLGMDDMKGPSEVLAYQTDDDHMVIQTQRYLLQFSGNEAASNR